MRSMQTLRVAALIALVSLGAEARAVTFGVLNHQMIASSAVTAVTANASTVYVAGGFSEVGPAFGQAIGVTPATGGRQVQWPVVTGRVWTAISDNAGGWYIGGDITNVAGQAVTRVAHITSSGSLDTAFLASADNTVYALALGGGKLYIGGSGITSISGGSRTRLGAVNATTGALDSGFVCNISGLGGTVEALALNGSDLYVGGQFNVVNGTTQTSSGGLARVDASTGALSSATANPRSNGQVSGLAVDAANGVLYATGNFSTVNSSTSANSIAGFSLSTYATTAFTGVAGLNYNGGSGFYGLAVTVNAGTVYVGGNFTNVNGTSGFNDGTPRNAVAAFNGGTGAVVAGFTADVTGIAFGRVVYALGVHGGNLIVGGAFDQVNSSSVTHCAAVNLATGVVDASFNPRPNDIINALAIDASTVYLGGPFSSVNGLTLKRRGLAAFDAATGLPISGFDAGLDGGVSTLVLDGSTLYIGGNFTNVNNSVARQRLAAVNASTGADLGFSADAGNSVNTLLRQGSDLYVGGNFTTISNTAKLRVAKLNAATGAIDNAFTADADAAVQTLATDGSKLFVGGAFSTLNTLAPAKLQAVDLATGAASAFNANVTGASVFNLLLNGSTLYAGGNYTQIGGLTRNHLAALDKTTGNGLAGFDAGVSSFGLVRTLALNGIDLYLGGTFTSVAGGSAPRTRLAVVNKSTGAVDAGFTPDPDSSVVNLAYGSGRLYAGGGFSLMGGLPYTRYAALTVSASSVASAPAVSSLSFNSAPVSGTTGLVITGTDFTAPLTVTVKGVSTSFVINSATQITAAVPANTAGADRVVVTNASGSSADVAADDFSYYEITPPVVSAASPTALTATANVLITAHLFDADSGIDTAQVVMTVDGSTVASATDGVTVSYTAASLPTGTHYVTVTAKDLAGNGSNVLTWAFNTKPVYCGSGISYTPSSVSLDMTFGGGPGTANGQFDFAMGVAAGNGFVYITDNGNNRIQKFTTAGAFVSAWGSAGSGPGQFSQIRSISMDPSGNLWVADMFNSRVQKFSPTGTYLTSFTVGGWPWTVDAAADGYIYVDDVVGNRFAKFNQAGVQQWSVVPGGTVRGIAVDALGTVYVGNPSSNVVRKYDTAGNSIGTVSGLATASSNVAVDLDNNLYVVDGANLKIFNAAGTLLASHSLPGNATDSAIDGAMLYYSGSGTDHTTRRYSIGGPGGGPVCNFDTTAPTASAAAPSNGSYTRTTTPLVWAQLADAMPGAGVNAASVVAKIDTVVSTHSGTTSAITLSAGTLSQGLHSASLDYSDLDGNVGTQLAWSFTVDSLSPTASNQRPAPGSKTPDSTPLITASLADGGSGVNWAGVTLSLDGSNKVFVNDGSTLSFTASVLASGPHTVVVTAPDTAGNSQAFTWSFNVASAFSVGSGGDYADLPTALADLVSAFGASVAFPNPVTLSVMAGTYGPVTLSAALNPQPGAGLNIVAASGTHPVINAAGGIGFSLANIGNVTLSGFQISNASVGLRVNNGNGNLVADRIFISGSSSHGIHVTSSIGLILRGGASVHNGGRGLVATTSSSIQVTNMTFAENAVGEVSAGGTGVYSVFKANILYNSLGQLLYLADPSGAAHDENLYYAPGNSAYLNDTMNPAGDLAAWKANTGHDAAGLYGDPYLRDSGSLSPSGYQINWFSPAKDKASSLYGLPNDWFGSPRNPDLGFSEFVQGTGTAKPLAFNPSPAQGATVAPGWVTISASLLDNSGTGIFVTGVAMTVDGAEVSRNASATLVSTTANLSAGLHTITVDVPDNDGRWSNQLVWSFTVGTGAGDVTAPVISGASITYTTSATTPLLFASLTDTASATASGIDLASVVFTLDGVVEPATVTAGVSAVSVTFTPLTALAPGVHHVSVDVKDQVGNAALQKSWTFTISTDTIAPTVGNPTPLGVTTTGTPFMHVSLSDAGGSGVNALSVSMTVDGIAVPALANATDVSFTPSVALSDGTHTVTVDVADNAANQATQFFWTFEVASDIVAPVISGASITYTSSASMPLLYASLTDTASGIDLGSVVFTLDGTVEPATVTAGVSSVDVTFTPSAALALGVHHVTVDVKDIAGNSALQKAWSFLVIEADVVAPVISGASITYTTSVGMPLLYASLTDTASGIDLGSVVFTLDGTVEPATVTAGVSSVDVTFTPSAALALGVHHVTVDVKDIAGNSALQKAWSFLVIEADTVAPVITSGSPTGVTSNADTIITALFTETGSGINTATAVLRLDGVIETGAVTDGVSITFTASGLDDGVHTVSVDVKDNAGNIAQQLDWQFTVQSDVTVPMAGFQGPTSANPVTIKAGTKLDVVWEFTEDNPASALITTSGIPTIYSDHTIDMSNGNYGNGGFFGATLDSLGFVGGSYVLDLSITLRDKAGNVTTTVETGAVVIDGDAPTASLELPSDGSTEVDAAGNTTLSLQLSDTGGSVVDAASVKLYLDGLLKPAATTPSGAAVSVSYSATGLSAGVHTVTVEYSDAVGNSAPAKTWSFTMVRDNVAPVVSAVSAPISVTVNAGSSVDVSYTYFDANPAYISITVSNAGGVIGSKEISTGLLTYTASRTDTVDLSTLAAGGAYDVKVSMFDTVSQLGSLTSNASVVVDRTAPTASLNVPTGVVIDAAGNTTLTLQLADAVAGVNAASVKLYLDGVLRSAATTPSGAAVSVTYSATGLSNGLHTVSVEFSDVVGNPGATETWSFTMVRDNVAPVVFAVISPTAGAPAYVHATGTADVRWFYVEANPAWVSITVQSGGSIIGQTVISSGLASAPTGLTLTTAVPLLQNAAPGVYDVVITMQDTAIHAVQQGTATSANSVVVDNTAPTASAGLPAGASINQTAAPVVSAVLADAGGSGVDLNSVVLRLDGVVRTPSSLTATLVSFNSSGLADGPHTASVELKDKSGNPAETYSWSFRTDTKVPAVAITAPLPGAYVRGNVALDSLATDAGSGVTKTAFYRGGSTLIDTAWFTGTAWANGAGALSPSASVLWDTTVLPDGLYVLKAVATDLVANDGTSSNVLVTVDNTAPVVSINTVFSPTQYQAQTITGSVTEQNLSYVRVNGILATLGGSAPNWTYKAVVPLHTGANGITVTAGDLGGINASALAGITVDPTAAVQFIRPAPGSVHKGTVDLELTVPDLSNTLTLEVSDDNGATWYNMAGGSGVSTLSKVSVNGWRLAWNTITDGLADANGSYQLRAVAYDQYGVQLGSTLQTGLSVDNTAPVFGYAVLPAPVLVGPNLEVYQDQITIQGSVTETGQVGGYVQLEHYNSTGDHVTDSPSNSPLLADNKFSHDERLVEGYNRFVYTVFDAAGNSSSQTFTLYYVRPQNSGTICAAGGGLGAPDGTSIQVPANALISCVSLSIKTILRSLLASPADPYLVIVGEGHQVEPVSLVFQAQATLTLPYTDADLDPDANSIPDYLPTSLKVLFWDGSVWQNVGVDSINTTTKRVTVRTNHLGLFALAADTAPIPAAPKVYLTKNPFRYGSGNPTSFVYELPVPGRVTIRIFDKGGDEVRTLVNELPQLAGRFTQVWDGLNNFDRFVGSGIYFFRFEAKLDSGQTVTNTKAIGVLK